MPNIYRVRYKKGDVELDIESSDKEYVDRKLAELRKVEETQNQKNDRLLSREQGTTTDSHGSHGSGDITKISDSVLVAIIASINDAENYEAIEKHVLDKHNRTARILMCYYFAHRQPGDPALTTTHVERITQQLGIKIAAPNVAKVIRQGASRYLTADRVRKERVAVHYTINRRGITAFENMVSGPKL